MSDNVALVTDASKAAAQKTLDDYAAGVAAHIGGDWAHHNQARIYPNLFTEPSSGHQASNYVLRLLLTNTGVDKAVIVPAIISSEAPSAGSAPLIVTQPASLSVAAGASATFSVVVASPVPVTYQWKKTGIAISGKTASSLAFPAAATTDAGVYSVAVTSANGSVTSANVTLAVT